jgi:transcriptional antiterminator RfaH
MANRKKRLQALTTGRIVRALETKDQHGLWHDLEQINQLSARWAPLTPEDRLAPGMTVQIRSGPLAGLVGKILQTASGRRFVVQVNFIQRGATVLLDDCNLMPVK